MRVVRFLIALACLAFGVAIGALNPRPVAVDLGFTTLHATLGVVILAALLSGVVLGGIALAASQRLPKRGGLQRRMPSEDGHNSGGV